MSEADPDAELLARVARKEPDAVREMVTRKLPRLLSLAQRLLGDRAEAEDIAQEACLRIWKHAAGWQARGARFDTWLHRVALNLCYDRLRSRREQPLDARSASPDMGETVEAVDGAPLPDQAFEASARQARVAAALAALPARQREALVLHYYQELSNNEAAQLMDVTVEALESLLARGRRALRAQLAAPGRHAERTAERTTAAAPRDAPRCDRSARGNAQD